MNNEFKKAAQEFKDWNKKFLTDSIITPDVATATGSNRIGQTVWTRFTPSASFISENYADAVSFILDNLDIDDLIDDPDLVELHNILQDYVFMMDKQLSEGAMYTNKTSPAKKIKNRKRYKRDRLKILARIKRQKNTVKYYQDKAI